MNKVIFFFIIQFVIFTKALHSINNNLDFTFKNSLKEENKLSLLIIIVLVISVVISMMIIFDDNNNSVGGTNNNGDKMFSSRFIND